MDVITLLIVVVFAFGFFVESIFGFAGAIIALAALGLVIDIKEVIFMTVFIGLIAAFMIICFDFKSLDRKKLVNMLVWAFPGVFIGSFILDYLSSALLALIFGIFLVSYGIYSILNFSLNNARIEKLFLFLAGLVHGFLGTGGPFAVIATSNKFANKSEMRTTLVAFLFSINALRILQYGLQGTFKFDQLVPYWWLPLPVLFAIWLGHQVHLKISEKSFKMGIDVLLLVVGIIFILK